MLRGSPLVQNIGDVIAKTHRCVAFPNLYQHQVQPFNLEDPTKPGHRKMLVFFLIDPTRRVPSATDVAPQQREWVTEAMHSAGVNSRFARLPVEILKMISEENEATMTRLDAELYRWELMAERTVFAEENDEAYFGMVRTHTGGLGDLTWDIGDFDQSFLRQDPGDLNFERDFGQWFNPGGDLTLDMR